MNTRHLAAGVAIAATALTGTASAASAHTAPRPVVTFQEFGATFDVKHGQELVINMYTHGTTEGTPWHRCTVLYGGRLVITHPHGHLVELCWDAEF